MFTLPHGVTTKGLVCLALWRAAHGKRLARVRVPDEEIGDICAGLGVPIPIGIIKSTISALVAGHYIEVSKERSGVEQTSEFKVNAKTEREATRCASALGTVLVPPIPKEPALTKPDWSPSMSVMGNPEPPTATYEKAAPKVSTKDMIDAFMSLLCDAGEAEALRSELSSLRGAQNNDAVNDAIKVLAQLDLLRTSPLGMMLEEKFPGITTKASVIAGKLGGA